MKVSANAVASIRLQCWGDMSEAEGPSAEVGLLGGASTPYPPARGSRCSLVYGCHFCTFPIRDWVRGVSPMCDLVHFEAIWWQLFVGRNFATKVEPNCQLQCAHDCTVGYCYCCLVTSMPWPN